MLNVKFINWYRTVDFNGLQETLIKNFTMGPGYIRITSIDTSLEKFPIILCYWPAHITKNSETVFWASLDW